MSATSEMRSLLQQIERRLESNEDFRAWRALSAAIAQAEGRQVHERSVSVSAKPRVNARSQSSGRRSYADAATESITKRGEPMTTTSLLRMAIDEGLASETTKSTSYASSLSRDERLVSVRYNGERHWWLAGRALPYGGEIEEAEGQSLEGQPSASNTSQGGSEDAATLDEIEWE